jgi:subtilisin family serine protease
MERRLIMLISSMSLILIASAMAAPSGAAIHAKIDPALNARLGDEPSEKIPIIVMLKNSEPPDLSGMDVRYKYSLINGIAGGATPSTVKRLSESDSVEGIYLDGSTHVSAPSAAASSSQALSPAMYVNADKLWAKGIDGKGVTVAVIDSGIDKNHPDLDGKVVGEKNFVESEVSADDFLGHGTMVAGIIAGSGAASGGKYKGIAPGASLLNVKVIDSSGDGKVSDIIAGIEWAVDNGADILTLSLGGLNLGETNPPITMAADNAMDKGIVVCVAAGNRNSTTLQSMTETKASSIDFGNVSTDQQGPIFSKQTMEDAIQDIGNTGVSQINPSQINRNSNKNVLMLVVPIVLALPPGLIDSPGDGIKVITVGASDYEGHVADFSGSGPTRDGRTKPDVLGPGMDIVSAIPPGLEKPEYLNIYYAKESGTSLSTPVAAGVAALLLQAKRNITPAGVKAALTNGAKSLNNTLGEPYEDYYQGSGLIDANKSYEILSDDLCGVEPSAWVPGRWAYLPAGKGIYVGLNTGADRPQKKLYALAPGDDDWATQMTFFTNKELTNLITSVSGAVADWTSIQPLTRSIPANGQRVFGAAITVPNGTSPGIYCGSIDILEGDKKLISIPITVNVAAPIEIAKGMGLADDSINGSDWRYYYLDIPGGTSDLKATLRWKSSSNIDLFLLAPTSEYYSGNQNGNLEYVDIQNPPSGRWLMAVHGEMLPSAMNYTLRIERSLIESFPKRWNVMSLSPGSSTSAEFKVENKGPSLENLSYQSLIENVTPTDLNGTVGPKEIWESNIDIQPGTRQISAKLSVEDNSSELLFMFEDPNGEPADADLGSGNLGPIEVQRPQTGIWKMRVYGYDVPTGDQPFNIHLMEYADEPWSWIRADGPRSIESDSNATINASIMVPKNTTVHSLEGYLEMGSADANRSMQIPVSVTVLGPQLQGLSYSGVDDANKDGYFDNLFLGFGINATAPESYRLMGSLVDCEENIIEQIDSEAKLNGSGMINVTINGSEIWKRGKCAPLRVENLLLYDDRGELLDRHKGNITLNRSPKNFQPPAAYLTGEYVNNTAPGTIKIGVGVKVIRPGSYQISGRLVNDDGDEMGVDTASSNLAAGNATLFLSFNPTKFMMIGIDSRLHLVDLTLTLNGAKLDAVDRAWDSGLIDPKGLSPSSTAANANYSSPSGNIKMENGKAIIS